MKELIAWDDLHLAEDGERVHADGTLNFGVEGNWYAVDVTTGHGMEFMDFLSRYMRVAERRATPPKTRDVSALFAEPGGSPEPDPVLPPAERQALPPSAPPPSPDIVNRRRGKTPPPTKTPVTNGVLRPHAVGMIPEDYWEDFRTWCAHVKNVTLKKGNGQKKQWYYPGHLIREYEEHLTALDKAQAQQQQLPLTG